MLLSLKSLLAFATLIAGLTLPASAQVTEGDDAPLRFGRFEHNGKIHYG